MWIFEGHYLILWTKVRKWGDCFLSVFWMFSECSPTVLWVFSECSLSVLWVFSDSSLCVSECSLGALRLNVLHFFLENFHIFIRSGLFYCTVGGTPKMYYVKYERPLKIDQVINRDMYKHTSSSHLRLDHDLFQLFVICISVSLQMWAFE